MTWAFPVILNRVPGLRHDLERAPLRLVVDSPEAVAALEDELADSSERAHVWLKVDCGYHRAGVDPAGGLALDLARRLHDSDRLIFDASSRTRGMLTLDGRRKGCWK